MGYITLKKEQKKSRQIIAMWGLWYQPQNWCCHKIRFWIQRSSCMYIVLWFCYIPSIYVQCTLASLSLSMEVHTIHTYMAWKKRLYGIASQLKLGIHNGVELIYKGVFLSFKNPAFSQDTVTTVLTHSLYVIWRHIFNRTCILVLF